MAQTMRMNHAAVAPYLKRRRRKVEGERKRASVERAYCGEKTKNAPRKQSNGASTHAVYKYALLHLLLVVNHFGVSANLLLMFITVGLVITPEIESDPAFTLSVTKSYERDDEPMRMSVSGVNISSAPPLA